MLPRQKVLPALPLMSHRDMLGHPELSATTGLDCWRLFFTLLLFFYTTPVALFAFIFTVNFVFSQCLFLST